MIGGFSGRGVTTHTHGFVTHVRSLLTHLHFKHVRLLKERYHRRVWDSFMRAEGFLLQFHTYIYLFRIRIFHFGIWKYTNATFTEGKTSSFACIGSERALVAWYGIWFRRTPMLCVHFGRWEIIFHVNSVLRIHWLVCRIVTSTWKRTIFSLSEC